MCSLVAEIDAFQDLSSSATLPITTAAPTTSVTAAAASSTLPQPVRGRHGGEGGTGAGRFGWRPSAYSAASNFGRRIFSSP